ncbi:MAG: serine/threonine protein kinase, partial [Planctomycetaceae bacterium]|nr:serine/threonine protein kinase [Planctomycetaceae bacterium]
MSDSDHLSPASETMQFVHPADSGVSDTDSLEAGTILGHYVIKKYIGGGGMGRVYLAADMTLDRDVAIKVLPQQRSRDQSFVARFMNEAKSAARLNHEHIAQVYFAGDAEVPFIAFEYVEGTNVRTMVEEHDVFPLPQALNYLLQIAQALAHAATHGVVHRDVKPS